MRPFYTFCLVVSMIVQSVFPVIATPLRQTGPQWIFFYSLKLRLDGAVAEGGTVIGAFVGRTGKQCGAQRVTASGALPLLTCYMADPASNVDGVIGGDLIYFTVNGLQAAETYQLPGTIFNGQRFELRALTTTATKSLENCIDGYENDDAKASASSITGPEAHTFYSHKRGWDQDWGTFTAKADYVYQIQARSSQPFNITPPVLRLYNVDGVLLEENTMDKWGRGAEIWWWNGGSQDHTVFLLAEEKAGHFGCRHYTLTVKPWSPTEFAAQFSK